MMDTIEEEGPLEVDEEGSGIDIDKGMAAKGGEGEYGHEYNEECNQKYNDWECNQGYNDWIEQPGIQ